MPPLTTDELEERYAEITTYLNELIEGREAEVYDDLVLEIMKDAFERTNPGQTYIPPVPSTPVVMTSDDVEEWIGDIANHAIDVLILVKGHEDTTRLREDVWDTVTRTLMQPGNALTNVHFSAENIINSGPIVGFVLNRVYEETQLGIAFPDTVTFEQRTKAISASLETSGDVNNEFDNAVQKRGATTPQSKLQAAMWLASMDRLQDDGSTALLNNMEASKNRIGPSRITETDANPGNLTIETGRVRNTMLDEDLSSSTSPFGAFGLIEDIKVTGTEAIEGRFKENAQGFITDDSIKAAVEESLRNAGIAFTSTDKRFPDTPEGRAAFNAADKIRKRLIDAVKDEASKNRGGLTKAGLKSLLTSTIESGTDAFATDVDTELAAAGAIEETEKEESLELKGPALKAVEQALFDVDPLSSLDTLTNDDLVRFLDDVRSGRPISPRDAIAARKRFRDFEARRIAAELAAQIADDPKKAITATNNVLFNLSKDGPGGLLTKDSFSPGFYDSLVVKVSNGEPLDIVELRQVAAEFAAGEFEKEVEDVALEAGVFAISPLEVLRALEKADYGNVGDLGEYQQHIRSFLPEIIDNLETIRRRDPTATLDVVSLLKEEILPGIEGFQTQDEFEAELLRKQTPLSALRIRQDLDKERDLLRDKLDSGAFLTEEEKGLLGVRGQLDEDVLPESPFTPISPRPYVPPGQRDPLDPDPEQERTDILPPGVPGLPGLDVGIIEQPEFKRRQMAKLGIIPPAEGELEDIAFAASGGDPWFQKFLLSNLDPEAISKAGEEEAKKRRQAAWDKAIQLQETPKPFEMGDISGLSPAMVNQLLAQKEQRSKGPVLTLEEAARFADRPLPPVQFEPLVQEQIPELKKQFEQSPAEVARRQLEEQDIEDEEERARREREQKQQRALTRRGRTVFTGLNL
jgi:hypothetical protein